MVHAKVAQIEKSCPNWFYAMHEFIMTRVMCRYCKAFIIVRDRIVKDGDELVHARCYAKGAL